MRFLLLAMLALGLVNCSGSKDKTEVDEQDLRIVDLPIKIQPEAKLSDEQKTVAESVSTKKAISFKAITKLMIEKHVKAANDPSIDSATMQAFIAMLKPGKSLSPSQTKIQYEEKISKKHNGHPLKYNATKVNIIDIYKENRVQCYSGTYLYELVRRQQSAASFRAGNEVVIFESGHVLPGYMIKSKDGYHLMGIETTMSGGARKHYGLAKDLSGILVVDAELFAVTEVFKNEITNSQEVAKVALETTAKKYGIPLDFKNGTAVNAGFASGALNESIFAFGRPDTKPGDQERSSSSDDGKTSDNEIVSPKVRVGNTARLDKQRAPEYVEGLQVSSCKNLNGLYSSNGKISTTIMIEAESCNAVSIADISSYESKLNLKPGIYSLVGLMDHKLSPVAVLRFAIYYKNGSDSLELEIHKREKTIRIGEEYFFYRGKADKKLAPQPKDIGTQIIEEYAPAKPELKKTK